MTTSDILFNSGRVANATNFVNLPVANNLYLFLGMAGQDSNPETPAASVNYEKETRADMFFMQKIQKSQMVIAIPKIQWNLGVIYTQYDPADPLLFTKNFYVVLGSNVYKCLSNNHGIPSVNPPVGTSVFPVTVADGYQWKFMYNISDILQADFTMDQYIPVPVGIQRTDQQIAVELSAVETATSPAGGHGYNASLELGASNVMLSLIFSFNTITVGTTADGSNIITDIASDSGLVIDGALVSGIGIPDNTYVSTIVSDTIIELTNPVTGTNVGTGLVFTVVTEQRQFGMILNPLFNDTTSLIDPLYVVDSTSNINKSSGTLLQVEQHAVITPSSDDVAEIIQIVISF